MKNIVKKNYKLMIGLIIGVILSATGVYGAEKILSGNDFSYSNGQSEETVQEAIDDLYKKAKELTGEGNTKYKEDILNGADPVLGEGMIPVTIDKKGKVKYASLNTKWYSYKTKKWANAVILSSGNYKVGDEIPESAIQSYFVWIPRYSYKIWDEGNYTSYNNFASLKDSATDAEQGAATALRRITGNARLIDIQFGASKNDSSTSVGNYHTNEAFTTFNTKGLWVGKFEVSGNESSVMVKPNKSSWRNATVAKFWNTLYNYKRNLDSHMMKNIEWGAVAYLAHSAYGIGNEININNNSNYMTGYSAASNTDQSSYPGEYSTDATKTQPYNTAIGYLASTTGNITGIYDMSGGAHEYMASYIDGYGTTASGLSEENLKNEKYFDKYSSSSNWLRFNQRKLGDATGEMGPFYYYYDKDKNHRVHNAWYADTSSFVDSIGPWFGRGGHYTYGVLAGQFSFSGTPGGANVSVSSRLVLTPTN